MSPGLIHYLAVVGAAALSLCALLLVVVVIRDVHGSISDWRRSREWRRAARRSASSAPIVPLSVALRRPRLGELYWLAHDASDPTTGGVPCEVVLVDRTGAVHREVPLVRLSRMPE
jgi:hypothetical protein